MDGKRCWTICEAMQRVPEPDLMTELEQAQAYGNADFSESNQLFVDYFKQRFPEFISGQIVDLGCGPAEIPIRLIRQYPDSHVIALDGSQAMLDFAEDEILQTGLQGQIQLQKKLVGDSKGLADLESMADAVVSNSLLHHMSNPEHLWQCVINVGKPGAMVLVMDLARPETPAQVEHIINVYAANEPEVLRTDFKNSLFAAYTVVEVETQLEACDLSKFEVALVSDRHLMVSGLCPAD